MSRSFTDASNQVAAALRLALQHEADLVVGAAAFLASHPEATTAEVRAWTESVRAFARYQELESIGSVAVVPHSQLPSFAARVRRDGQAFTPPSGDARAFYCFSATTVSRPDRPTDAASVAPPGLNLCDGDELRIVMTLRDSAAARYIPYGKDSLAILTPYYRGGVVPASLEMRRRSFLGFSGTMINPQAVLEPALTGHPRIGVRLVHRAARQEVAFSSGAQDPKPDLVLSLGDGWTAETAGLPGSPGVFGLGAALQLLAAGCALSLALGALVLVLGTGRARALRLVHERTREIEFRALHDALTGLPNRVLLLDRLAEALARAHRADGSVAVMFLDLDGFKDVNDTYGHAVGDQLLQEVSARLTEAVRDGDTVGRLGGDEFVIVLADTVLPQHAEATAERIRDCLAQPFTFEATVPVTLSTHASIGVAIGVRESADQLLRDADMAMYSAKSGGKNAYVVVEAREPDEVRTDARP